LPNVFRRGVVVAFAAAAVAVSAPGFRVAQTPGDPRSCPVERLNSAYSRAVERALRAGRDVWGETLLRSAAGPTYQAVRRYLKPLLLAGHVPGRRSVPLTDSGVYYVPFAVPQGPTEPGPVALHLADGSEIVSEQTSGPRLVISVGADGNERYGSCLARLGTPRLAAGYLPVLETRYVDASGVRYQQESFAARIPQTSSPVSFVRLTVDPRGSAASRIVVRFTPSVGGLTVAGHALLRGRDAYLLFGAGGTFTGSSLTYVLPATTRSTLYVAWVVRPSPTLPLTLNRASYDQARQALIAYWRRRLSPGLPFVVPEQRILDAERALLIQNLEMAWRYSIGNPYEEFEYPESLDAAAVMGEYGFADSERATLETSLAQPLALYPNWEMGAKLVTSAEYYRLFRDRSYVAQATPILRRYLADLAGQAARSRLGLLHPERWTSDLSETNYALDSQAVVWQGLDAIAQVWAETGYPGLARQAHALAIRLGAGLRKAVGASQTWLPDGSLFIPIKLYTHEKPYAQLTASRDGSYWNLEIPYALASGLFPPGGRQATGVLRYMLDHGSRLLGLVRCAAFSLYSSPRYPTSGSDDVYLLNMARFLADNEQAGQLVLSLYAQLAAGMTQGTFVSGESATIAPLPGQAYRSMYLPPNSTSNAAFLETLRLTLIHEVADRDGLPQGLELAYATPRAWLRPGRTIRVSAAPTSFGPISYTIAAQQRSVHVSLTVPNQAPLHTLRLRLRLPDQTPLRAVMLNGKPFLHFDAKTETIDLSGQTGTLTLAAEY
jgi:hypothetical protein